MPNVKNNIAAQATCRRLIEAAGKVFASHGLEGATIKQITDEAKVNTAAINYHYGDKYQLYDAVIRQIIEEEQPRIIPGTAGAGTPEQRLRRVIRHFLHATLATGTEQWKRILVSRELAQPTACFDRLVESFAKPLVKLIEPIVRELLGEEATREEVDLAVAGILGHCLYYPHHREMIARVQPQLTRIARTHPQRLADHVVDTALGALSRKGPLASAR